MLVKEKFYRVILSKKINFTLLTTFLYIFFTADLQANFQKQLINKYKTTNTLSFDFIQIIGEKNRKDLKNIHNINNIQGLKSLLKTILST